MGNETVALTQSERERKIVQASIVGVAANVALAAVKAIFGLLSNSIAIVLDAVNNLSDAMSSIITIIGTRLAARKPDRKHPYGHGRTEYITTIVIAAIVLWAGITSLSESVHRILEPQVADYSTLTLIVVAIAVVAKIVMGRYASSRGKALSSDSLSASGTDATMDAVISASTLVAALIFMYTGLSLEAWLGAAISLVIIKAGIDILREAISKIIGERADSELTQSIRSIVEGIDGVHGAYDLVLNDYGPERLMGSIHVEVDDTMTAARIDALTREIQAKVNAKCGVVLHTVGIYSSNTKSDAATSLREQINGVIWSHKHVMETHGFYLDEARNFVNVDVVVGFDDPDRHGTLDAIKRELSERFPQYTFNVILDSDMSD